MPRQTFACLTGHCLDKHFALTGQLKRFAAPRPRTQRQKNKKSAEKKQPCKRKDDCFIPEHKIQAKTLGENEKKFRRIKKSYTGRKFRAKSTLKTRITSSLNRNSSQFLPTTVLQHY